MTSAITGVILADIHGGHLFGLTMPDHQLTPNQAEGSHFRQKAYDWQRATADWFQAEIQRLGPIDIAVSNGDAIEGKGYRSGGTELLTSDRHQQCSIAEAVIRSTAAPRVLIIRGTPSHTGEDEDWEDTLADRFGVEAQDHAWLQHGSVVMDFKHHLGSSTVPRTAPPALARDTVWNLLWSERDLQPKSNFFVRSHLHEYFHTGNADFTALVTPALQGWTKYGAKRMSKTITYGFVSFRFDEEGFSWKPHILVPTFAKAVAELI